jgi:hypothetical protein
MESAVKAGRLKKPSNLADRLKNLKKEAIDLRKQARGMPPGIRREELLRKASRADTEGTKARP